MSMFHTVLLEAAEEGPMQRTWLVVRRLYGVVPVMPPVQGG
jgi:hypothetical protein